MKEHKVSADDNGIRLDRWFKRHMPEVPHAMLQKYLRKGQVRVSGKKVEASHRIKTGDAVQIRDSGFATGGRPKQAHAPRQRRDDAKLEAEFNKLVIYEDKDYIIINKPSGLATQGGSGITVSVDDMIHSISERYKLVHRLDKDTSGVLAIAKKTTAAATFSAMLQRKDVTKIYWALVNGVPDQMKGIIKFSLAKKGAKMERVEVDEEEGKKARTEYTVLEKLPNKLTWLELSPITGRTHQLRVHCAAIGCPIVGDGKYGGSDAFIPGISKKLHLHARRLVVPELGIDITAGLPPHMRELEPDER